MLTNTFTPKFIFFLNYKFFFFFNFSLLRFYFLTDASIVRQYNYDFLFVPNLITKKLFFLKYKIDVKTKRPSIQIKKNLNIFFKNMKYWKFKVMKNYRTFAFRFFFLKFFYFTSLCKIKLPALAPRLKINDSAPFLAFVSYKWILLRNWHFLIGHLISPLSWQFTKLRQWNKRKLLFNVHKNPRFSSKQLKRAIKYRSFKHKQFWLFQKLLKQKNISSTFAKKLFLNNFFYLNKWKIKFKQLKVLFKLKMQKLPKNFFNWYLLKPYLIFNNKQYLKRKYANYFVLNLYKKYRKFFFLIRKLRLRFRKIRGVFFKKYCFNKKKILSFRPWRQRKFFQIRFKTRSSFFLLKALSTNLFSHDKILQRGSRRRKLVKFRKISKSKLTQLRKQVKYVKFKMRVKLIWHLFLYQNIIPVRKRRLRFVKRIRSRNRYKYQFNVRVLKKAKRRFHVRKLKFFCDLVSYQRKLRLKLIKRAPRRIINPVQYPFFRLAFLKRFYKSRLITPAHKLVHIKKHKLRKVNMYLAGLFLSKYRSLNAKFLLKKKKKFISRKIFKISTRVFFLKRNNIHQFNQWAQITNRVQFGIFKSQTTIVPFQRMKFLFNTFEVFSRYLLPIFFSRTKLTFRLTRFGFLFISDEFLHKLGINEITFIRKNLYSFSYKNELHKYILRKYTRKITTMDVSQSTPYQPILSDSINYFNQFIFHKSKTFFIDEKHFDLHQTPKLIQLFLTTNFPNTNKFIHDQFKYWKNFSFADAADINIKRIRFKPGYATLWRNARLALKVSWNLKMRYQYRLTNYLTKYNKFIKTSMYLTFEMQLFSVLLKTRLLPDPNSITLFLQNNLIYVNGSICANTQLALIPGDFIQCVISLKYYILHKWLSNWELRRKNRLKKLAWKKSLNRNYSDEKQRSTHLPQWILGSKNSFNDVAKYLEVDYFTLSAIIIYEPFLWTDINFYNLVALKYGVINMYNWKYIT